MANNRPASSLQQLPADTPEDRERWLSTNLDTALLADQPWNSVLLPEQDDELRQIALDEEDYENTGKRMLNALYFGENFGIPSEAAFGYPEIISELSPAAAFNRIQKIHREEIKKSQAAEFALKLEMTPQTEMLADVSPEFKRQAAEERLTDIITEHQVSQQIQYALKKYGLDKNVDLVLQYAAYMTSQGRGHELPPEIKTHFAQETGWLDNKHLGFGEELKNALKTGGLLVQRAGLVTSATLMELPMYAVMGANQRAKTKILKELGPRQILERVGEIREKPPGEGKGWQFGMAAMGAAGIMQEIQNRHPELYARRRKPGILATITSPLDAVLDAAETIPYMGVTAVATLLGGWPAGFSATTAFGISEIMDPMLADEASPTSALLVTTLLAPIHGALEFASFKGIARGIPGYKQLKTLVAQKIGKTVAEGIKKQTTKQIAKEITKDILKNWATQGAQEAGQEFVELGGGALATGKVKPIDEWASRMGEAYVRGGNTALILGGANTAVRLGVMGGQRVAGRIEEAGRIRQENFAREVIGLIRHGVSVDEASSFVLMKSGGFAPGMVAVPGEPAPPGPEGVTPPTEVARDIGPADRKALIEQYRQKLVQSEVYQLLQEAKTDMALKGDEMAAGIIYVDESMQTEVKEAIGRPGEKGYNPRLAAQFTFDPANKNYVHWDEALGSLNLPPDQDNISGLIEYKRAMIGGKWTEGFDEADMALAAGGDPQIQLDKLVYDALKNGETPDTINNMIMEWGREIGATAEQVQSEFLQITEKQYERGQQEMVRGVEKETARLQHQKERQAAKAARTFEAITAGEPTPEVLREAHRRADKSKQPVYIYPSKATAKGLFTVSSKPPRVGTYTKVYPEADWRTEGKVEKGIAQPSAKGKAIIPPEREPQAKKLRQQIHAVAAIKGLTDVAFKALKRKVTTSGQAKSTLRMSMDELQNLLKKVQAARPKRIGYKQVITKKTEDKIQSLKQSLINKQAMNETAFADILSKEIGQTDREPKYIDAKNFITEQQGKDILRRMNNTAELIRLTEPYERAIAGNDEIAKAIATLDAQLAKPMRRDPWSLESMRYYSQEMGRKTGVPFYEIYKAIINTQAEINKNRSARLVDLEAKIPNFIKLASDEAALNRVRDYIVFKSDLKNKPDMPTDITEEEISLAKAIEQIFENYRLKARIAKFFNWIEYQQPIAEYERFKAEINKARDIYERQGKEELIEYLKTQTWGVKKSGYDPIESIALRIRVYDPKPTTFGKSHIKIRTAIEYQTQEKNILQGLLAYMRQMDMLSDLAPKIKAYIQLVEDNLDKFNNPARVRDNVETFIARLKHYNPEGGLFERTIKRLYAQAMKPAVEINLILAFRNMFQVLFIPDSSTLIDPRNKSLTPEDVADYETYHSEFRHLIEDYFMVSQKPLPGLKTLSALADKIKLYPLTDLGTRYWIYWAKINQVRRALKASTVNQMMQASKFADMKPDEQKMALAILAKDGEDAMARYIAGVITDNVNYRYAREERAPAEMTPSGEIIGNLFTFTRNYAEQQIHAGVDVLKGRDFTTRWRGLKRLWSVIIGGMIGGVIIRTVTGRKRNEYDPLEILMWTPGGLAWGTIDLLSNVYMNILMALKGDEKGLNALTIAIPQIPYMFVPFYSYFIRSIEAATDKKNIDRKALRQIREMIDNDYKMQGGAYRLQRDTLQAWQYILSGRSVDLTPEEKRKQKKQRGKSGSMIQDIKE